MTAIAVNINGKCLTDIPTPCVTNYSHGNKGGCPLQDMDIMIACCGLDCAKCEAYIATKNDDDELRRKVAKKWSELNDVEITPEMINCEGCRTDGKKTPFCESLCPIKMCILGKGHETCGNCPEMESCGKLKMVVSTNIEALERLRKSSKIID